MIYYRLASQDHETTRRAWKSTALTSLQSVFQLLRTFSTLPQDNLHVFSAASKEGLDEQLKLQNTNHVTYSVTARHFLQSRKLAIQGQSQSQPAELITSQTDHPAEIITVWAKDVWDKHSSMRTEQASQPASAVVTFSSLADFLTETGMPPSML